MSKNLTTMEWVAKAVKIHNGKYTYKNTNYVNCKTKVTITCPEHGDFEQLPNNHLKSNGCYKCGRKTAVTKYIMYTDAEILEAAKTCKEKREFQQKFPNLYMASVNRNLYDKACSHMAPAYNKLKTTDQFKAEMYSLVGNDYALMEDYINRQTNITIKHNVCGNSYKTMPATFLRGSRCPNCVTSGFNINKPAILYYIKVQVKDIIAYKIGVTNLSLKQRYSLTELSCITPLLELKYELGIDAYNKEQQLLKEFLNFKYKGPNLLYKGNTELFTKDISEHENFRQIIQINKTR